MTRSIKYGQPSPVVCFVGRKNSGKTTLVEQIIKELTARGRKTASIKHHGHPDFEMDIPGKDSWRHHFAGAKTSAIISDKKYGKVCDLNTELSLYNVLNEMPGFDLIIVEGYRKYSLPYFELLRQDNERDIERYKELLIHWENDFSNTENPFTLPQGVITDIAEVGNFCKKYNLPHFTFSQINKICDYLESNLCRQRMTVVIQAGGESRRMGQPKALVPFREKPLIEHAISLVKDIADELIITTNQQSELNYLKDLHPWLKVVCDVFEERGATPGFITAFACSSFDCVGILACDMVCYDSRILSTEATILYPSKKDAIVPKFNGFWEPFSGIYKKSTCEQKLLTAYNSGIRKMQEVLDQLDIMEFDLTTLYNYEDIIKVNPFVNVNTPEDVKFSEQFLM